MADRTDRLTRLLGEGYEEPTAEEIDALVAEINQRLPDVPKAKVPALCEALHRVLFDKMPKMPEEEGAAGKAPGASIIGRVLVALNHDDDVPEIIGGLVAILGFYLAETVKEDKIREGVGRVLSMLMNAIEDRLEARHLSLFTPPSEGDSPADSTVQEQAESMSSMPGFRKPTIH
jgi:hypothetical protein